VPTYTWSAILQNFLVICRCFHVVCIAQTPSLLYACYKFGFTMGTSHGLRDRLFPQNENFQTC
jgi:hypothetical protein